MTHYFWRYHQKSEKRIIECQFDDTLRYTWSYNDSTLLRKIFHEIRLKRIVILSRVTPITWVSIVFPHILATRSGSLHLCSLSHIRSCHMTFHFRNVECVDNVKRINIYSIQSEWLRNPHRCLSFQITSLFSKGVVSSIDVYFHYVMM